VPALLQHLPFNNQDFSGFVADEFLELGGIDTKNSVLNIGQGPGIRAVVGCASVTGFR